MLSYPEIYRQTQTEVALREATLPLEALRELTHLAPSPQNGAAVLHSHPGFVAVMGEIKRQTPTAGFLDPIEDPAALAREYVAGGAVAVSVVTETPNYLGTLDDFKAVRRAVEVPLLRKEYVVTPYQIHESRVLGADMVLLMVALLEPLVLGLLVERTQSLGMEPLVECHSRLEARQAIAAGARIIGLNARNRETGEVDRNNCEQIIDVIPPDVTVVAESGVRGPRDVFNYARVGADAVLVGESLVRSSDPRALLKQMTSAAQHPALRPDRASRYRHHLSDTDEGDTP
ncbi:indole-3-glycerol phosphate synthase TrpC [Mobiluncus mulieris]|uniref:indole-3-glycerol-phosphate synthase n=2 Tax=Mobiluncus mulieris TaxID=2052 RepID=E0QRF8_9ACTO|nr:indole-3-glycerol-phosphate synthase [Mobiluncus mulieris]EEJ54434.1 indole-3-glycerol phosphate synthase [Mobiluncus mulieris ATCC 35243]EEZ91968.1 indole-3-glycerol phosphate synthase [Mobiluncus mulieris 28-1]EFM45666.1 indole-3-glycerol phosphate synthase [Mobiluncus mulieris ATCC 35239]EFN93033.1 indole-3-glycerol phosphate synthase [Mobiluncus mulieris FB024-16]MBB5846157.1 indole-3-glycerol phosphate synthase [Mobiluncus mulieris]